MRNAPTESAPTTDEQELKPTLEELVFTALGEVSMCWDPIPSGVFESSRAKEIGERLIADIKAWNTRSEGEHEPNAGDE